MGRGQPKQQTARTASFDGVLGFRRGLAPGQSSAVDSESFPPGHPRTTTRVSGQLRAALASPRGSQERKDAMTQAVRHLNVLPGVACVTRNESGEAQLGILQEFGEFLADEQLNAPAISALREDIVQFCAAAGIWKESFLTETVKLSRLDVAQKLLRLRLAEDPVTEQQARDFADAALLNRTKIMASVYLADMWTGPADVSPLQALLSTSDHAALQRRVRSLGINCDYPEQLLTPNAWEDILDAWTPDSPDPRARMSDVAEEQLSFSIAANRSR